MGWTFWHSISTQAVIVSSILYYYPRQAVGVWPFPIFLMYELLFTNIGSKNIEFSAWTTNYICMTQIYAITHPWYDSKAVNLSGLNDNKGLFAVLLLIFVQISSNWHNYGSLNLRSWNSTFDELVSANKKSFHWFMYLYDSCHRESAAVKLVKYKYAIRLTNRGSLYVWAQQTSVDITIQRRLSLAESCEKLNDISDKGRKLMDKYWFE